MSEHKGTTKPEGAHGAHAEPKHSDGEKPVFHKRIDASPVREAKPPKK